MLYMACRSVEPRRPGSQCAVCLQPREWHERPGDVVASFGGYSGNKLGNSCSNETAPAGAYQKVIDRYQPKAIDVDLEAGEVSRSNKVVKALRIRVVGGAARGP
jgi:hypothetical protein